METKKNKLLHNIKIWWISILSPLKHVLKEYRPLLMKMTLDAIIVTKVATNLNQLCDVQLIF
jgi:uncharacterized circularly permuted ATP-grasp superfamily protein